MNLANANLAQLRVPVEEFERGTAFYRDILGLPFLFAAPPQMAFFMCGPVRLLVGVLPPDQPRQRGGGLYPVIAAGPARQELPCSPYT